MPVASIVLFLLAARAQHPGKSVLCWAGFWLALTLLILSCSKSSLIGYSLLFTALACYLAFTGQRRLAVIALVSVLLASGSLAMLSRFDLYPPIMLSKVVNCMEAQLAAETAEAAPVCFGVLEETRSSAPPGAEDHTGTGRVKLWLALGDMIWHRPWLGYGFGGFWLGRDGPSAYVLETVGWATPNGHNGFLDLWLDLGAVGLLLFTFSAASAGFSALRRVPRKEFNPVALLAPALLAQILLANIGESDLFAINHLFWICFVCIAMSNWPDAAPLRSDQAGQEAR
jgi:hypothetical protein